ncbi:MAG TPA: prenyltransferase/squalene oxidase repeat-containing protein [Gemmataceae bacterium]|nr:prenyltransferase/squalene oxidase repeat-containing protein [Gemmataceae bacterium]
MRRIFTTAVLLLFAVALPARAEPPKREAFEVAIDNALQYLAGAQNADGSWPSGGFGGGGPRDPAVAALSVMAFLSAGHVPGEGKYGNTIMKGVRYVCAQQQQNGVFAGQQFGMTVMYSHGICTLMVAEVIGLMPDRKEAAELRARLVAAVRLIKSAQCPRQGEGGWRYTIQPNDADMSVTAWQFMALRAAKNVGCDAPPTIIDRAVEYVKNSNDRNTGGYRYTRYGNVTLPCTGAAILSLELSGKDYHKSPESLKGAQFIVDQLVADGNGVGRGFNMRFQQHFFYGVYYTSQAMFQVGGKYWNWYRQYLHWLLLNPQAKPQQPSGFWNPVSGDDQMAGVNYCTAMAVLALTVEYRFLPIYQRGEEPEEREGR